MSQVHPPVNMVVVETPVVREGSQNISAISQSDVVEPDTKILSINSERQDHERKKGVRNEQFKKIVLGEISEVKWKRIIASLATTIVLSIGPIIPPALIPLHNLFLQPEYWYEALLIWMILFNLLAVSVSIAVAYYMNHSEPSQLKNLMMMCLIETIICIVLHISSYMIWTKFLKFHYPIPFAGFSFPFLSLFSILLIIWIKFPPHWRKNGLFKRRMLCTIFLMMYPGLIFLQQLDRVYSAMMSVSNGYQMIIAMLLPFVRELNIWIVKKVALKATNGDQTGATIVVRFAFSAMYSIYVCFILGSSVDTYTSLALMGMDSALNFVVCLRIVWINKRHSEQQNQQIDLIQELVVNELVEFLAPGAYILAFALLIYGSNCDLIGNLCNDYWSFESIQDFTMAFQNMGLFLLIELLGTIATAIVLRACCNIDIMIALSSLQEEFEIVFCMIIGVRIFGVSRGMLVIFTTFISNSYLKIVFNIELWHHSSYTCSILQTI